MQSCNFKYSTAFDCSAAFGFLRLREKTGFVGCQTRVKLNVQSEIWTSWFGKQR